jgi:regulator of sigma D
MTYQWDNKKPTAQMLGRWQPFHDGHYKLFQEIIKKTAADDDAELDQAIRDVFNSKNEQLLEKNQSLLNVVDDERNEKIKEFVD